jgi:probable phosphoglycerate mutase
MTILVVRHGETDGNAARILQRPDVPLNERGMRQAEELARRLFAHGFVYILCSDLLRARMTAAPLAACSGITIEESPLLQERDFGDLRGVPYAELTENPFGPDFVPPNGEDWPRFHARVAEAFALILSRRRGVSAGGGHAWFSLPSPSRAARAGTRRHLRSGDFRQHERNRVA